MSARICDLPVLASNRPNRHCTDMARFDRAFLDRLLDRISILDVVGQKVSWDRKKSNPGRGDMWACCPFHGEKTPSFHAEEAKSSYHCFGCGASGNAIDFVMAQDNLSFPEAVERLARDAGMALPARDPQAVEREDQAGRLIKVLDAARDLFEQALRGEDGQKARQYLERRGLGAAAWKQFGLGWAPNANSWLKDRLSQAGFSIEEQTASGVLNQPDDGRPPYDRFRGRVMFAIEDTRGRTVSFGARTLDPDGQPKYLNGPETPVFDKGRMLYRFFQARPAARNQLLVVAEGYMDVIALELAGIPAVAPMGTALTEDQLQLAWKACPTPVMCLDGDSAGQRAAGRALERALPLISADRSLQFVILPEGKDPDDLIKSEGAGAMRALIDGASPFSDFLFQREVAREPLETPEARARAKRSMRALLAQLQDGDLKAEMTRGLLDRLDRHGRDTGGHGQQRSGTGQSRPFQPGRGGGGWRNSGADGVPMPSAELRRLNAGPAANQRVPLAEMNIVAAAIGNPGLLEVGAEALASLELSHAGLDSLRHAVLDRHFSGAPLDFTALEAHFADLGDGAGASILRQAMTQPVNPFLRPHLPPQESNRLWLDAIERMAGQRALQTERAELQSAFASNDVAALQRAALLKAEERARRAAAAGMLGEAEGG
jgi:DNA primase